MIERQIRIFVPPSLDHSCWVETVVGRVIKPMVEDFRPQWMWFSRYGNDKAASSGDCDISKIPDAYALNGLYRSVRFRVRIRAAVQEHFEEAALKCIEKADFKASGFLEYGYLNDLGADRFFGEPRNARRKEERAELMARFLDSSARLFCDAITDPDEKNLYRLEENRNAFTGNSFEAMRHLFCNMTNAPTPVRLDKDGKWLPNPIGEVQIPYLL